MSNISEFLQKILSARYGKEVRQSIHDAIKEVDNVADNAKDSATNAAEQAHENANRAEEAAGKAEEAALKTEEISYEITDIKQQVQVVAEKAEEAVGAAETAVSNANEAKESERKASEYSESALSASQTAVDKAEDADKSATDSGEYAKRSQSYAVGGTGSREGENQDNAKYYYEQSLESAKRAEEAAESIPHVEIATTEKNGIVKPDGVTIIVEADGTLRLADGEEEPIDYNVLHNKPYINNVELSGNKTIEELGLQPAGKYCLVSEAGHKLELSIDNSTYIMTLQLLNSSGNILSEKTVDFPLESMVVNATYKNGKITLTLQNGNTVDVDVSALVSGLVKDTFTIAGIDMKDDITVSELKAALEVDKVTNVAVNDQAPTFTQASTRVNIASGEKISTIFGKIMKWFADLKTVAFSGSYDDLSNKPTIPTVPTPVNNLITTVAGSPLDAMQGKVLDDKITGVNNSLVIVRGILVAGETEITIEDSRIAENSALSFYASIYGINPTGVVVELGSVTLIFDAQAEDMEVGVRIDG